MFIRIGQRLAVGAVLTLYIAVPASSAHGESFNRVSPDSLIVARPTPDPAGSLTLEGALALVVAHHPKLRGAAWRLRGASARRGDASRWSSPTASVDLENLGGSVGHEIYETTASLSQTLELGGDRGARAEVAAAAEQMAWAELSSGEGEVLAEAVDRFLHAWTLQERVTRLSEAERLAERSIVAAAERFRAGAGPALEQARAEAVLALRRSERIRAGAELAASRQRLATSWGGAEARFDSLELPPPPRQQVPPPLRLDPLLDAHPQRQRATAELALESARLREARAARVPDLDVGAGVRRLAVEAATTFVFTVSAPLPLWGVPRGHVAAAEAEREAAAAQAQFVALDLRSALRRAYEQYAAAQETYELITSQVKPKTEEVLRQLTAGYRGGRFSSLEYLEGQRSLLEAELQVIEATAEAWRAGQALERLLGRSLEALGEEDGR